MQNIPNRSDGPWNWPAYLPQPRLCQPSLDSSGQWYSQVAPLYMSYMGMHYLMQGNHICFHAGLLPQFILASGSPRTGILDQQVLKAQESKTNPKPEDKTEGREKDNAVTLTKVTYQDRRTIAAPEIVGEPLRPPTHIQPEVVTQDAEPSLAAAAATTGSKSGTASPCTATAVGPASPGEGSRVPHERGGSEKDAVSSSRASSVATSMGAQSAAEAVHTSSSSSSADGSVSSILLSAVRRAAQAERHTPSFTTMTAETPVSTKTDLSCILGPKCVTSTIQRASHYSTPQQKVVLVPSDVHQLETSFHDSSSSFSMEWPHSVWSMQSHDSGIDEFHCHSTTPPPGSALLVVSNKGESLSNGKDDMLCPPDDDDILSKASSCEELQIDMSGGSDESTCTDYSSDSNTDEEESSESQAHEPGVSVQASEQSLVFANAGMSHSRLIANFECQRSSTPINCEHAASLRHSSHPPAVSCQQRSSSPQQPEITKRDLPWEPELGTIRDNDKNCDKDKSLGRALSNASSSQDASCNVAPAGDPGHQLIAPMQYWYLGQTDLQPGSSVHSYRSNPHGFYVTQPVCEPTYSCGVPVVSPLEVNDFAVARKDTLDVGAKSPCSAHVHSEGSATFTKSHGKRTRCVQHPWTVQVLQTWYEEHENWPYPTAGQKADLSETTGVTVSQVTSWFANKWAQCGNMQKQVGKRKKGEGDSDAKAGMHNQSNGGCVKPKKVRTGWHRTASHRIWPCSVLLEAGVENLALYDVLLLSMNACCLLSQRCFMSLIYYSMFQSLLLTISSFYWLVQYGLLLVTVQCTLFSGCWHIFKYWNLVHIMSFYMGDDLHVCIVLWLPVWLVPLLQSWEALIKL